MSPAAVDSLHPDRPRRRAPLTRGLVVRAGLAYIDQHGLEELSLHKLGAQLGVRAMSLYNHVTNKDDLYDGIVDLLWSEVEAAVSTVAESADWQQVVRDLVHAIRAVIRAHPHAASLLITRPMMPIPALRAFDTVLTTLHAAGFPDDYAADVVRAAGGYALGMATSEVSWTAGSDVARESELQRMRRVSNTLPADVPDHLVSVALRIAGDCNFGAPFELGLDLMLRGLDRSERETDT